MSLIGEIVNPSDKYTLDCSDWLAAAVGVAILGEGWYAIDAGEKHSPMFLGDGSLDAWWAEQDAGGVPFGEWVKANRPRIAAALETVVLGDRRKYLDLRAICSPDDHAKFDAAWEDQNRSSMNNIGKRAKALAEAFRKPQGGTQDA